MPSFIFSIRFSIRRAFPLLALLAVLLLGAVAPAAATSYVNVSDENLARQASVIAEVRVASVEPAPESPKTSGVHTDYQVEIERLIKGYTAGSSIVVRVLGGVRSGGLGLKVWGAPVFKEGDRALLFLKERADGSYGILHLMLGAFHEVTSGGRQIALRDLSEASEVRLLPGGKLAAGTSADLPRDAGRFADWLADRANGTARKADYFLRLPASEVKSLHEKFTLFVDAKNGNNLRWFEFDGGGSVTYFADSGGQGGLSDGGFPEFQAALAAWTNNSGTPIRYLYGGKTTAKAGLKTFDGINAIVFGDPNNELAGTFDCSQGGTLAMGGIWSSSDTTARFNGKTYDVIQGGDVVVNDGLDCFFQASHSPQKAAEELFGHELGHTLGLGHSSESTNEKNPLLKDALMYAFIHDDGRGARFNTDDLNAIRTLYNPGAVIVPPPATGPCKADAQHLCLLGGRFSVQLSWQNQFDGSTGVGRAVPATDFTGYFSFGDPANLELLVKILDFGTSIKVFYGELTNLHFTLTVTDTQTGHGQDLRQHRRGLRRHRPELRRQLVVGVADERQAGRGRAGSREGSLRLLPAGRADPLSSFRAFRGAGKLEQPGRRHERRGGGQAPLDLCRHLLLHRPLERRADDQGDPVRRPGGLLLRRALGPRLHDPGDRHPERRQGQDLPEHGGEALRGARQLGLRAVARARRLQTDPAAPAARQRSPAAMSGPFRRVSSTG